MRKDLTMPVVHELFGKVLSKSGAHKGEFQHALCPHMYGKKCDGGGNRDMARWPAQKQPLALFFDLSVGSHYPLRRLLNMRWKKLGCMPSEAAFFRYGATHAIAKKSV